MTEVAGRVADSFELRVREQEERWLSPLAVRSYETRGRAREESPCRLRTPFQRDRDRIVHSKAFRRLRNKTQVWIDPEHDHFRTRLTHTVETTGISRGVARALGLNEDLVEAIGLGHDLGHTPFGHTGEECLDAQLRAHFDRGFRHNEHSLRIVDELERDGRGLNLTQEVRDGILNHTGPKDPATLEGRIVRIVDRVAYINHDLDDAVRAGDIRQSDEIGEAMLSLRSFMFERVYLAADAKPNQERAHEIVRRIFAHLVDEGRSAQDATDYVAGMTDRFALAYAARLED